MLVIVGTRPEAIKMFSPVRALLRRDALFETFVCSTGQHHELLTEALAMFDVGVDYGLAAMRADQEPADVAWRIATWVTGLCRRLRPDFVLVQGDTTTTLAAGLAAFYCRAVVGHVEAGLRTYDNSAPWPEEAHRRMVDAFADLHFAPSELAAANLLREGVSRERVHVTGNTGIDALHWVLERPRAVSASRVERRVLVTAHRRESIPGGLESIARAVQRLAVLFPDVHFQFVVHPNPSVTATVTRVLDGGRPANVELLAPLDYVSFIHLLSDSFFVLTDSGGLQEEAPALGKPVLVVNPRTARQEPLTAGTASLIGTAHDDIVEAASRLLEEPSHYARMASQHNPYGDGLAGERIVEVLATAAGSRQRSRAVAS